MSRYEWPVAAGADAARQGSDDPAGRARFTLRRHLGLRSEEALRAGRAAPAAPATRGARAPLARAPANGRALLWQPLGPATLLGGQAEGKPRVSGRINALAVHDGGQRGYAASANGGVWYTKDGGVSWVSVGGLAATNTAGILRPAQRNACGAIYVEWGGAEGEDQVFLGTGEVTHEMTGEVPMSEGGVGILVGNQPVKSAAPDPWQREAPNLVNNGVYRIVREHGGTTMIAATRTGLYQRPAGGGVDAVWTRPTWTPFDSESEPCSDVLWTAANGGRPSRLWVWVQQGSRAGLWVRDAGATEFVRVALEVASPYGYSPMRAALAALDNPSQLWVFNDRGSATLPALFRVSNPTTASAVRPKAQGVVGVPNIVHDSGFYNIAIAIDPGNANRVALAGSWYGDPNNPADAALVTTLDGARRGYDAGITVAVVAPDPGNGNALTYGLTATPFVMIGIGVHPDVHALAYSNGGATLWSGCDGGVFRSDRPLQPVGFYSRNNGLSISESNFVACHPVSEGNMVVGLQDNGTVQRRSSAVWQVNHMGDGGGVVLDPVRPNQYLAQYVQGSWRRVPSGGTGPFVRGGTLDANEDGASAFYSEPASIAHVRVSPPAAPVQFSQTLIGSYRLWYTEAFGAPWATAAGNVNWVTLPSGTDPLAAPVRPRQDSLGGAVLSCRWQDADNAWVLTANAVHRFTRTPGSHMPTGAGAWTNPVPTVLKKNVKNKDDTTSANGPVRKSPTWTGIAPNPLPPAVAGQPMVGALYLGTVGHADDVDVDTLWWFDGATHWFKTGLRANAVPAPVTALLVDPALPDEVWVGTTVGIWKGVRTRVGTADPTWAWTQHVNGLPEAAVEDLSLFSNGSLKLLRAAIAARGIWELRLDQPNVTELTYLRVHDDDLRHRLPTVAIGRDGVTPRSWHGSPDVRPRIKPVAVTQAAGAVWWRNSAPPLPAESLRRFQAALRSSVRASTGSDDPRIVANGVWDGYFSEVVRDHGAPTTPVPPLSRVSITKAFWDTHMVAPHATAEPWGAGLPSEADLHELTPALPEGDRASTSCTMPATRCLVDVVVHHRGLDARTGTDVRVTLLKWVDPKLKNRSPFSDSTKWYLPNVPWTAAVNQVLNGPNGASPGPLTDGWAFVGNTNATRRLSLGTQTLEPLSAGVVTFEVDLRNIRADTVVLLVVVIRVGPAGAANDIALAPAALEQLALNNPQVAVRSVRMRAP